MANKSPPVDRPRYLLDLQNWEIRLYDDLWNEPRSELQTQGYGAISYAWGKWKDRTMFASIDPKKPQNWAYPKFRIGNDTSGKPLSWVFPVVRIDPLKPKSKELFTIQEAQHVLGKMGLRYVWWDWACIPQGFFKTDKPEQQQWLIHPELQDIAGNEVNKMRYVYPHSKRGTIWAHTSDFNKSSAVKAALTSCSNFNASRGNTKTIGQVRDVVQALQKANQEEIWLQSLWCFQEGVLFSQPERDADVSSGVIRDHNGASLSVSSIRGEGDLWDWIIVSSAICDTIISFLRYRAEAPTEDPFAPPKNDESSPDDDEGNISNETDPLLNIGPVANEEPRTSDPNARTFQRWCYDTANQQEVRQMMDDVVTTGLVFYTAQSPLSLLNARWSRERGQYTSLRDVAVNTIIGALEVDIKAAIDDSNQGSKTEDEKIALQSQAILVELFRIYSWRMLLFASKRRVPTTSMQGIWSILVGVRDLQQKLPTFTSLEYFLATVNLQTRFKPPPPALEGDASKPKVPVKVVKPQFALPELEYSSKYGYLTVKKLDDFKLFDLSQYDDKNPLWKTCMFYDFNDQADTTKGIFIPLFKVVPHSDRAKYWGDKVVLIPIEYLERGARPWDKKPRLRCAVVSNFGKASSLQYPAAAGDNQAGVFVGIADLEGEDKPPEPKSGNLDLAADILLY